MHCMFLILSREDVINPYKRAHIVLMTSKFNAQSPQKIGIFAHKVCVSFGGSLLNSSQFPHKHQISPDGPDNDPSFSVS